MEQDSAVGLPCGQPYNAGNVVELDKEFGVQFRSDEACTQDIS